MSSSTLMNVNMKSAICLRCGEWKHRPWATCKKCGFDPTNDPLLEAKSVFLSTGRYVGEDYVHEYHKELEKYSERIKSGEPIEFPQGEIDRLLEQRQAVSSVSAVQVYLALLYNIWPLLLIIVVGGIVFVARCNRQ